MLLIRWVDAIYAVAYTSCFIIQSQASALHYASNANHVSVVECLIKGGADVNAVDKVS